MSNFFDFPTLAAEVKNSLSGRGLDDLYRVRLLKRAIKTSYRISESEIDEFFESPDSTGNADWDAAIEALADYICTNILKLQTINWNQNRRLNEVFEPMKPFITGEYQTKVPEQFLLRNVILPEGSLKCIASF